MAYHHEIQCPQCGCSITLLADSSIDTSNPNRDYWLIPVTWESFGLVQVAKQDHPTLEAATNYAVTDASLPIAKYVPDSIRPDWDGIANWNSQPRSNSATGKDAIP